MISSTVARGATPCDELVELVALGCDQVPGLHSGEAFFDRTTHRVGDRLTGQLRQFPTEPVGGGGL